MPAFEEIYTRIKHATTAKTQVELAALLGIRQSSISDAKRRDTIPAEWYIKLFDKYGLNPDWLKSGLDPMYLRSQRAYALHDDKTPSGLAETHPQYGEQSTPFSIVPVYSLNFDYDKAKGLPELISHEKIPLPQSHTASGIQVFKVEGKAMSPTILAGAYVGVNTCKTAPVPGDLFAVLVEHKGLVLRKLFVDLSLKMCVLRGEQSEHPESRIPMDQCRDLLFGRVEWVLQEL